MNNFIFQNATKVYFGQGCVKEYLSCLTKDADTGPLIRRSLTATKKRWAARSRNAAFPEANCSSPPRCGFPMPAMKKPTPPSTRAKASIDKSLKNLQTDYIDLLLIHQPFGDYYGAYRAMEEAYRTGKLRAIGVSNFYPDRLIDLCQFVEVTPAVNQVETHVFQQQKTAHAYMKKYGVQHESWGPFAEGRKDFFTNPVLTEIGAKYGKSAAQTALRFLIQSDVVVIPKSTHKERMEQNLDVFDFTLSQEDMEAIRALDEGESLFFSHYDPATVEMLTNMGKTRIV